MINSDQWKNTLPGANVDNNSKNYDLDPKKWLNTLPKIIKKV